MWKPCKFIFPCYVEGSYPVIQIEPHIRMSYDWLDVSPKCQSTWMTPKPLGPAKFTFMSLILVHEIPNPGKVWHISPWKFLLTKKTRGKKSPDLRWRKKIGVGHPTPLEVTDRSWSGNMVSSPGRSDTEISSTVDFHGRNTPRFHPFEMGWCWVLMGFFCGGWIGP